MIRGTTPTHIFHVNMDLTEADVLYVTYKQGSQRIVEKTIDDVEITPTELKVTLTQEDTLGFKADNIVEVQIRAGFPTGERVACEILMQPVERILKDGVI